VGIRGAVYLALAAVSVVFSGYWGRRLATAPRDTAADDPTARAVVPSAAQVVIGLVTNFFDTLGIGSFAPTTSVFKLLRIVPDRLIPGTLLAGHSIPTLAQAFIYITIIEVDMRTLALLIGAAVLGAWLGAGVVSRWPQRPIRIGMGIALLVAAAVFLATALRLLPGGGEAVALHGTRMAVGLVGNFLLGALMTIGIGAYAPSLILFGLLGMNLKSVFPIMMGSCAFLMPISGMRFVQRGSYAPQAALGLTLGGLPGVLLAAFLVREMSVDAIRWLVIAVATYAAVAMLRSAGKRGQAPFRGRPCC
jgi:uncharacterized membrane protein YfcA